jgi:hypothetical protein
MVQLMTVLPFQATHAACSNLEMIIQTNIMYMLQCDSSEKGIAMLLQYAYQVILGYMNFVGFAAFV